MTDSNFRHNLNSLKSNLYHFALMLTCDREQAYELVQDTTVKAMERKDALKNVSNFRNQLLKLMRDTFISNYHQNAYSVKKHSVRGDSLGYVSSETPENTFAVMEVAGEIAKLSEELRVPMMMFIRGYWLSEISDELHVPLTTVKTNISRARTRLQKHLS